jgi:hypothetical protein
MRKQSDKSKMVSKKGCLSPHTMWLLFFPIYQQIQAQLGWRAEILSKYSSDAQVLFVLVCPQEHTNRVSIHCTCY